MARRYRSPPESDSEPDVLTLTLMTDSEPESDSDRRIRHQAPIQTSGSDSESESVTDIGSPHVHVPSKQDLRRGRDSLRASRVARFGGVLTSHFDHDIPGLTSIGGLELDNTWLRHGSGTHASDEIWHDRCSVFGMLCWRELSPPSSSLSSTERIESRAARLKVRGTSDTLRVRISHTEQWQTRLCAFVACLGAAGFGASNAYAMEPGPAEQTSTNMTAKPAKFAVTLNPLNAIIGRFGFTFEFQPVLHHGLVATAHYVALADTGRPDGNYAVADVLQGADAEVGYRLYTGSKGFNGLFVGPSVLAGKYEIMHVSTIDADTRHDIFDKFGAAFEVGAQEQFGNFIIGGGVGIQYTVGNPEYYLQEELSFIRATLGSGWRPRLLFNLGYAF